VFIQIVFVALLQILLGLGLCFAGYRLFVALLPVFGFFAGFLITAEAIRELFGGGFLAITSSWVFGFVVGLFCAIASYLFYVAAVAVLAAAVGYELGIGVLAGFGVSSGILLFLVGVLVAIALTAVVFALDVPEILIVVVTAAAGASMILTGVLLALGRIPLEGLTWGVFGAFLRESWFWSLVFLAIAAVGILAQLRLPKDFALEPYTYARPPSASPDLPNPSTMSASGPTTA
jgi:hypothetical protein